MQLPFRHEKKNEDGSLILPPVFEYPISASKQNIWNTPAPILINNKLMSIVPRKIRQRSNEVKIFPFDGNSYRPLLASDFPLIFVVHNGYRYLKSFLKHYRNIGVTRFLCVDDQSSDGTLTYLSKQPDVDVFHSNVRYREAARSKAWRELLAQRYGKNRWYLNVDVDEYLFTGTNQSISISEYACRLQKEGVRRLPAPMIDMIPDKLDNAKFEGDNEQMPWSVCPYFDNSGYKGYVFKNAINIRGGPRTRLYQSAAELMKYPLIYWDNKTSMGVSIHSPKPGHLNHAPYCAVLLHFKIFDDVDAMAAYAERDGQYFQGSLEYQRMRNYFSANPDKTLLYQGSSLFKSEADLVSRGFIVPCN